MQRKTERQVVKVVNTNKIKGRMKELEITQADVAKCLEIAQPTANQKINNVRPFDLNEAEKLAELLNIEAGDFGLYFFAQ
ncbi:helix-turn-helix domain-containing protein [Ruminococcus albus]|uniref:helix-turn-helix domain-containing protein n=1 Tax=Ruminococcus albus TaxID=1264 RepID=UPI001D13AAAC|nr:helix-turn-helix transcriptional regulator [Ruminococcus albus]